MRSFEDSVEYSFDLGGFVAEAAWVLESRSQDPQLPLNVYSWVSEVVWSVDSDLWLNRPDEALKESQMDCGGMKWGSAPRANLMVSTRIQIVR